MRHLWSMREYRKERTHSGELPAYAHRILFIAGLPKGGTNWIAQLLAEVPGYRQRLVRDWDRCMRRHDICDGAIDSLPHGLYSVMRTHTRWSPANLAVLRRHGIKPVVMHCDLRDQVISRIYHVLNDPRHPRHRAYTSMTMEDRVTDSIDTVVEHYVPWVSDWMDQIAREPQQFHELRYEELHADTSRALRGVLDFYEIPAADDELAAIVERVSAQTKFGLDAARLLTGGGTARKGAVGDWREYFTSAHVARFKRGAGELLVRLGQEADQEWTANRFFMPVHHRQ